MVNLLLRKGATQAWPRARIVARRSLAGTGALVRHYPACLWVTSRLACTLTKSDRPFMRKIEGRAIKATTTNKTSKI
eukprot:1180650-Prorocentrum_minimum.AAC.4